jgi:glycine oxidase
VQIDSGLPADDFLIRNGKIEGVVTCRGTLRAADYCICGGVWSAALASRFGIRVDIRPVRGQIALLDTSLCPRPTQSTETGNSQTVPATLLRRVVNDGPRYLVPRDDGQVLVGSTEEEAGFVKENTAAAIAELLNFAEDLCPALGSARLVQCWSGLRPATSDGLPYLGGVAGLENAYLAAGHFRQGLHLSPATAVVMSQLIRGETPEVDLGPFAVGRNS